MTGLRLYLIRHPQPVVSAGICYGRTDLPLARDVALLAEQLLPLLPVGAPLYCSPLRRCRELAAALHPAPQFDARLRELDFGSWEMRAWATLERTEIDAWAADPLHYCGHGGESVRQMQLRVQSFLAALPLQDAIIVTHGGVMKLIAAALLDLPQEEWLNMQFDYGTLTRIDTMKSPAGRCDGRLLWHNTPHA